MLNKIVLLLVLVCGLIYAHAKPAKLLVMYKTNGFVHKCIPAAREAVALLATTNNWDITFTNDSLSFASYKMLKRYKAIIFLCTTGDILGEAQQAAVEKYMQKGGGFVTVHTGSDTEKGWLWYMKMVGAKFKSHPAQQQATYRVMDTTHPATRMLPAEWVRFDEMYNFTDTLNPAIKVLISLDESTYKGGTMGLHHPIAWYQYFDGGRVFQTGLGHTAASYKEEKFLQHLAGGISWAAGLVK